MSAPTDTAETRRPSVREAVADALAECDDPPTWAQLTHEVGSATGLPDEDIERVLRAAERDGWLYASGDSESALVRRTNPERDR